MSVRSNGLEARVLQFIEAKDAKAKEDLKAKLQVLELQVNKLFGRVDSVEARLKSLEDKYSDTTYDIYQRLGKLEFKMKK